MEVPLDVCLALPMICRCYLVIRVMLLHSKLFNDASSRSIGALNKINFDTKFILKTLMTICPGTVLYVFMITFWVISSWLLRSCESYSSTVHINLLNSFYMTAITFLSVGYGDVVPHTECGRAIAVIVGLMGAFCTALVVAVIARKLELTRAEKHVHNFMMDSQLTKKLKDAAANVLKQTWFIYKHTKLTKRVNPGKVRGHQRKFLQAIKDLRKVKILQRKLNDEASSLIDVAKTQSTVHDIVSDMKHQQVHIEERVDRIDNTLQMLQLQLEALPAAIAQVMAERNISSSFVSAQDVSISLASPSVRRVINTQSSFESAT